MGIKKKFASIKPLGEGSLYAAQIGCVGFHSFPGEGAASWETAVKRTKKLATKLHEGTRRKNKKISVICVICGFIFFIVSG